MTLYERIQEIKQTTGWSQERISNEAGLALSTISRILRVPGYEPNETSRNLICQLHQELVKQPFPAELEHQFNLYDRWKEQYSQKEFAEHINSLEWMLRHNYLIETKELVACRLFWLLGHIYYDRAFYLRSAAHDSANQALRFYEKALTVLESHRDKKFLVYKYKLQQCIVSTKFNLLPADKRSGNEEIRNWLQSIQYLDLVAQVAEDNPWNWMAIRNGLVAASILEDYERCQFFWRSLRESNKRFEDLEFAPSKHMPAIADDPDLKWFLHKIAQH
jgi:transcriptional regulator with XRE-family HTH domain